MNVYYGEKYFPFDILGSGLKDILKEPGIHNTIIPILQNSISEFFYNYTKELPLYLKHAMIDIYNDIHLTELEMKNDVYKELIKHLIELKVPYDHFISYTLLFDSDNDNKQEFIIYLDSFTIRFVKNELEKICKIKVNFND